MNNEIVGKNMQNTKSISNNIILTDRKFIQIKGVEEVFNSNENSILLKLSSSKLSITGSNISITKLDIENRILEASGIFNSCKFDKEKEHFFKRVFK